MQFYCIGGSGGSENHLVSGVATICLTLCNTSPSHRVDQVVDCGLWNVGPLLFNGCVKLLDIARNWNTLSYTPIQSIPNMLNGWHEYAGHAKTVMFSASRNCVQILTTWGRALSCCNMRWWSWMNGTTMFLRISSRFLCAFKMPLIKCTCVCCPYACLYHTITPSPTWATRSTTLTSANRSPTQRLSCWLHRKYLRSLSSAHEKWGQKQKCCVYHFFQCIGDKRCIRWTLYYPMEQNKWISLWFIKLCTQLICSKQIHLGTKQVTVCMQNHPLYPY